MRSSFVAYVDESGDEGFKFLPQEKGSSRWFVLSALVIRKENDLQLVQLARQARVLLRKNSKKALHFRDLRHEQRVPFARLIGDSPVKTVSVLVHKPSIPNPEMFQQQAYALYRYATHLLLERVSWLCRDYYNGEGNGMVDMIFSNRSAMSYEDLRNYLSKLKAKEGSNESSVDWSVVDPVRMRPVNHDQLAGLQLADAVASSIFYSVHRTPYGETEDRYLRLMAKTIYRKKGQVNGYGLSFWCENVKEVVRVLQAAGES